jgi:hypothetical protein
MVFPRLERVFRVAYPEWLQEDGVEVDGMILVALEARDPAAVLRVSGRGWDTLEANIRTRADQFVADAVTRAAAIADDDAAGVDAEGAA